VQGRTTVMQWCFAAVSTVAPTLQCVETIEIFDEDKSATKVLAATRKLAARWFGDLERRLEGREWLAHPEFTVADIAMASVLRTIRQTDLMAPFPRIKSYYERCHARPAWQRTLALAAKRLDMSIDELR
jgi:glutathione S-transferase